MMCVSSSMIVRTRLYRSIDPSFVRIVSPFNIYCFLLVPLQIRAPLTYDIIRPAGLGTISYPQTRVKACDFQLTQGAEYLRIIHVYNDDRSRCQLAYSYCSTCSVHIVNASKGTCDSDTITSEVVSVNVDCLRDGSLPPSVDECLLATSQKTTNGMDDSHTNEVKSSDDILAGEHTEGPDDDDRSEPEQTQSCTQPQQQTFTKARHHRRRFSSVEESKANCSGGSWRSPMRKTLIAPDKNTTPTTSPYRLHRSLLSTPATLVTADSATESESASSDSYSQSPMETSEGCSTASHISMDGYYCNTTTSLTDYEVTSPFSRDQRLYNLRKHLQSKPHHLPPTFQDREK
jgi:hypothetical protein